MTKKCVHCGGALDTEEIAKLTSNNLYSLVKVFYICEYEKCPNYMLYQKGVDHV